MDGHSDHWIPWRGNLVYENPKGRAGHWQRHIVFQVTDNESPTFDDLTGDGKPELICQTSGEVGPKSALDRLATRNPTGTTLLGPGNSTRSLRGKGVGSVTRTGSVLAISAVTAEKTFLK